MRGRKSDMSEAEPFRVGQTYPCWYDPASPETAILKRELRPKFYAGALIPGFMLLVTGSLLLGTLREERERKNPPRAGLRGPVMRAQRPSDAARLGRRAHRASPPVRHRPID